MTCCTGSVYGPSRWPPSWATCGPPVGPWGSTPLLTTGGSGNSPPWSGDPAARERRVPRMANATSPLVEQRVVAFALGHPGFGPARIAAELARPKWGGIVLSTNGVWRVLRRHGISTRAKRYGLVAGYAAPPGPQRPTPAPERHLDVDHPGQLV